MNEIGALKRIIDANDIWTRLNSEEINAEEAHATFIESTIGNEFNLESSGWMDWLEMNSLTLGGDGQTLTDRLLNSEVDDWISVLTAIIRGERFNEGVIMECIENGTLQVVLQLFTDAPHSEVFPEEYDFIHDSTEDTKARKKGINPMADVYVNRVNERRLVLGVEPFMLKKGCPEHHIDALNSKQLLTSHQFLAENKITKNEREAPPFKGGEE